MLFFCFLYGMDGNSFVSRRQCNAGYYSSGATCLACATGFYSGSVGATACLACTNKPASSYYLSRTAGTVTTTNTCPWDCSAGFVKNAQANACVACDGGKYRDSAQNNLVEGGALNQCYACSVCTSGLTYQSAACTTVSNTMCTSCRTSCAAGQYMSSACTPLANTGCSGCATACPANKRLAVGAVCTGLKTYDEVLAACVDCILIGGCPNGYYLNRVCVGTETESNACVACSMPTCPFDQYRSACAGLTNTQCVPYTVCAAGYYLADESRDSDGVCRACSSCGQLATMVACNRFNDVVCKGASCGELTPCPLRTAQNRAAYFCDYTQGSGRESCGVCPPGYGGDGQFCLECPRGTTCNRVGETECRGQCGAGVQSRCDSIFDIGYAVCDTPCALPAPDTRIPWRGSFVRADGNDCATYFLCAVGYYKKFSSGGTVGCEECTGTGSGMLPSGARWVTEGLSVNHPWSCLWECRRDIGRADATSGQCVVREWTNLPAQNEAGMWLAPDGKTGGACGIGLTSEKATAMSAAECLVCPDLERPDAMSWAARTLECDWECTLSSEVKKGGKCVKRAGACGEDDTTYCQRRSFPLNRAGYAKEGWGGSVNVSAWVAGGAGATGLSWATRGWGIVGRHTVTVGSVERSVPGAVCSAALATLDGGEQYVMAALCNQSLLLYVRMSGGEVGVLIGNGTRGWRDGFRTQALFESELYVAWGGARTLYVLDRWNCLLREVVVPGAPGGYLTRAYTIGGSTADFALSPPRARCYGFDALSWPRKWWPLPGGEWLVFADEDGLWQLGVATKELRLIVRETAGGFEADALANVTTDGPLALVLRFDGGLQWTVRAAESACPTGYTSVQGGDCDVECPWLDSGNRPARFVDQQTGECRACAQGLACGRHEEEVACTPTRDAYCRRCEVYVDPACGACEPENAGQGQCTTCVQLVTNPIGASAIYTDMQDGVVYQYKASGSIFFPEETVADVLLVAGGGNGGYSIVSGDFSNNWAGGGGSAGTVIFGKGVKLPGNTLLSVNVGAATQPSAIGNILIAAGGVNGVRRYGGGVGSPTVLLQNAVSYANAGGVGYTNNGYPYGGSGGGAGGPGSNSWCGGGGPGISSATVNGASYSFPAVFGQAYQNIAGTGPIAGGGTGGMMNYNGGPICSNGLGGGGGTLSLGYSTNGGNGLPLTGSGGGGGGPSDFSYPGSGSGGFVLIKTLSLKAMSLCRCLGRTNVTYAVNGTCDATLLRRVPPCQAGYYAVNGDYCELCPAYTATRLAGAVRPEQCKCADGLVRRNGVCAAERLYEFETCGDCAALPNNATRLAGTDVCRWACRDGFYRDTLAGFADQCRPCMGGGARTPGDDDSPWSCE